MGGRGGSSGMSNSGVIDRSAKRELSKRFTDRRVDTLEATIRTRSSKQKIMVTENYRLSMLPQRKEKRRQKPIKPSISVTN